MSTHRPMGPGLEVDMETGAPLEPLVSTKRAREEERRLQQIDRYQRLLADLSGQGGEVLRQIADRLAARVDELVEKDPEAKAYLTILRGTQEQLAVGERMIAQDLAALFQREGLPGMTP